MSDISIDDSEAETRQRQFRAGRAGLVAGSIMIGSIALMAPFVISKSPLPYMGTPKHKLKRALEYCVALHQQHSSAASPTFSSAINNNKRMLTFVDLGSGDGEAVRQAVLAGYNKAIGIELNYTLYLLSQLRRLFFWTSRERRHSTFYCRDFFQYDLANANTVMIFGVKPLMETISRKLAKECRPGATILSYRFALPVQDVEKAMPASSSTVRCDELLLDAAIIYDEQEMRIYQKSNSTTTETKSTRL